MSILGLLILLILIGVGLYLVNTVIPMDSKIKTIINVVVVILVIVWLLDLLVIDLGSVHRIRIDRR